MSLSSHPEIPVHSPESTSESPNPDSLYPPAGTTTPAETPQTPNDNTDENIISVESNYSELNDNRTEGEDVTHEENFTESHTEIDDDVTSTPEEEEEEYQDTTGAIAPDTAQQATKKQKPVVAEDPYEEQYRFIFSLNPFLSKIYELSDLLAVEELSEDETDTDLQSDEDEEQLLLTSQFTSVVASNSRVRTLVELYETEREYVKSLQVLKSEYADPLSSILPKETHEFIFRHLETIIAVSKPFYESMKFIIDQRRHATDDVFGFMDIIMERAPVWRVYADYINHYDDSLTLLKKEREQNTNLVNMENQISERLKDEGYRSNQLHSFLVQPVQRVPRYRLLLNDILRRTHKDHPEYEKIQMALSSISDLASYCNSRKEELVSQKMLESLEKRLNLKNFAEMEDRKFLKECEVKIDGKAYTMYLFSDTIILNLKGEKRKLQIPLNDSLITFCTSPLNDKMIRVEMKRSEFEILTPSSLLRDNWLAAIQKQQQQFNKAKEVEERKLHEGWLRKQGGEVRTMKRRYHVLTNQRMKYFDRPNGKLKGSYSLIGAKVGQWSKRPHGFFIETEDRQFCCQAPNEEERKRWMDMILEIEGVDLSTQVL